MKANAPNKIYLYPSRLEKGKILSRWFMTRYNQNSVEYIRKDAFVEKTKEFIWAHTDGSDYHVNYVLKEFENFMKGE